MDTLPLANWPPFLPALQEDETLYSWCATVHRRACGGSVLKTSRALLGKPNSARLHDFPAHLAELYNRTGGVLGDPRQLATGHTLLGYYLAFQPRTHALALLERVISSAVPDMKMRLGIPASRLGSYHPLKYCDQCVKDDIARIGWAIWHLEHQLPSVLVCRRHQRALNFYREHLTPVHQREYVLPLGTGHTPREIRIGSDAAMSILLRLADMSANAAAVAPGGLSGPRLVHAYQRAAAERSALSAGGSVRQRSLTNQLRQAIDAIAGALASIEPEAITPNLASMVGTLTRRSARQTHPLKHLVLIAALYDTWQGFWDSYLLGPMPVNVPVPVSRRMDRPGDDVREQFINLVRTDALSLRRAASLTGISAGTGVRWAKLEGLPFTPRSRSLTAERLEQARRELRAGKEKAEIIAAARITQSSLDRLISSEQDLHSAWQRARTERRREKNRQRFTAIAKRHPGLPVRQLRKIPGNGWAWLYRHDRAWLSAALPSLWNAKKFVS